MRKITNREAIAAALPCKFIDDMRVAIARAAGVHPANVRAEKFVSNSQTGLRHQIFIITYTENYALTGKEEKQDVFIPINWDRGGVDHSRLDWDASDFSLGKPIYSQTRRS